MALLLPLWALISLTWGALPWLCPSRRVLGLTWALIHLALSVSAILGGLVAGLSDDGLPTWIIVPGVLSAIARIMIEATGRHEKK
ncbi:hypothetical protein [Streptomyces mesophilus]|uniref:hypothetical protein n=1 Tax=Streptomyces mesophilus TaxID=1775132 RepID=UPI00332942C1